MTAAITGTLTTPDGWPVGGGMLTVVDGTGIQRGRAAAREDGGFVLDGLDTGTYTVIIAAPGHEPAARTVTLTGAAPAALGVVELPRVGGRVLPAPGTWQIDPVHSSIRATAMHLGLTPVHGRLRRFDGRIQVADPLENSSVEVVIDSNGVDSDDDTRDTHLRSADFLDVDVHPEIHFKSDGLTRRDATHWRVDGILTLKGVSAAVPLDVTYRGSGPDLWGGIRAGFSATTEISRDDFAISWNQSVLAGVLAVGRTLRIDIDIQAFRT
ncbi:MAG: YceI family protein [Pseudonocardia sp.]|uniref:YceI family protein n=1 Tax=unclassified Pseudonocardia TaxID=2619320 RepID=UPI000A979C7F|nr:MULTISPECIES: YceI family protein [unclassified Pseudonocardia]MBN9109858.1 YceI family protein [Pseudonocardia sp.]